MPAPLAGLTAAGSGRCLPGSCQQLLGTRRAAAELGLPDLAPELPPQASAYFRWRAYGLRQSWQLE